MWQRTRRILKYLLLIILLIAVWKHKLIFYGMDQLSGQLHIVMNARPVSEVLADTSIDQKTKDKLMLIAEIRQFAFDSIGLKKNDNYTSYYDQQGKPVLWVITASERFQLKAYQWKFPVIGKVGYKGFFKKEKGDGEFSELKKKGYDVDYSPVGGWSTLGWFSDPVLSNMLRRSEGTLAELIIHELTHGTVYLKSSVDYNENFATFVGEQGAVQFLTMKYGKESAQLKKYSEYKSDESVYGEYIMHSAQQLDSVYRKIKHGFTVNEKLRIKYHTIAGITMGIRSLPLFHRERYEWDYKKDLLPDNTYFLSYLRYRRKQNDFENEFHLKYHNDLRLFVHGQIK